MYPSQQVCLGYIWISITKNIIEQAKPCMLVVNNVYAKRWMKDKAFNPDAFDFCFDEEIGYFPI